MVRIHIEGNSASAAKLREYVESVGYRAVLFGADHTIRIEEGEGVAIEGAGPLAAEARKTIAELASVPVHWKESGDSALAVFAGAEHADAVERGVLRALLKITGHGAPKAESGAAAEKSRSWWKRIFA